MKIRGSFSRPFSGTYLPDTDEWVVEKPFYFIRPNGDMIYIPDGWITDLASTSNIPGFTKSGPYNQAAVVHDFLYAGEFLPRKKADDIFKEAMECISAVPDWKIPIMYQCVRWFGGLTYFKHKKDLIKTLRKLAGVKDTGERPLWKDGFPRFV